MPNGADEPRHTDNNPVIAVDCVRVDDGVTLTLSCRYEMTETGLRHFAFRFSRDQALTLLRDLQRDTAPPPAAQ